MSAATEALLALRAAIDQLLAAPDGFDGDDELHAFVIGAVVEQQRLVAAVAPAVSRWDKLRQHRGDAPQLVLGQSSRALPDQLRNRESEPAKDSGCSSPGSP